MRSPLFLLLALLLSGSVWAGKPRPLVVGMELAYPPFEMTDPQGQPAGVSVDLAVALARELQRPLEIQNIPFDGLIPALKTGRVDLVISSMTDTAERRQSIDFSEPYLSTGLAILAGAGRGVKAITDLNSPERTVAVKLGTTGALYAREHLSKAKVTTFKDEAACALEVAQGKADAFLYDQMSVYQHWSRNPSTTVALLNPFRAENWAIGLRKGNTELAASVNAFLRAYRARGGFEELGKRHLSAMKEAFAKLNIPFLF